MSGSKLSSQGASSEAGAAEKALPSPPLKPKAAPKNKIKKKGSSKAPKKSAPQRAQERMIREIFEGCGFKSIPALRDVQFIFDGVQCDFDDIFILENVIVLTEYTTSSSDANKHLKNKNILFNKIAENKSSFAAFMSANYASFRDVVGVKFKPNFTQVKILYCPRYTLEEGIKDLIPHVEYLEYPTAKYFQLLVRTIRSSARFELLDFLGVKHTEFSDQVFSTALDYSEHKGSVLPEDFSNFGKGYKVVSFYAQPSLLLERSYVLRRGSWRSSNSAYQRMISRAKIDAVRKYLTNEQRAFINNIIVTLPKETRLVDEKGYTLKTEEIKATAPAIVKIPKSFNIIGLIDGQHRVYSYYEGGANEDKIAGLRTQLNLLVTGVIFPENISEYEKSKFEANLFLEINSNQTNPKSNLKHEINVMLKPFLAESVARLVLNALNDKSGALQDWFEKYFYDQYKLKNTSIVLYGLKPLVSLSGEAPLFNVWSRSDKSNLKNENDIELLTDYVEFCRSEINYVFSAIRQLVPSSKWSADKSQSGIILTTTIVNGFLLLLRRLAKEGKMGSREYYVDKLSGIESFNLTGYKSSLYAQLADDLYAKFFS